MGRPGGGGGGSHRSSSHSFSHHSSSHSHSGRSVSSSSRPGSSYGRSGGGFGPGPGGPAPRPMGGYRPAGPRPMGPGYIPPAPRRRGVVGGGCATLITMFIILIILFMVMSSFSGNTTYSSNSIDEDVVLEQADNYFSKDIRNENAVLLYVAYLEEAEADCAQFIMGDNVYDILNGSLDEFWNIYDYYYYSDASEGEWLGGTFRDFSDYVNANVAGSSFDSACVKDELDWISGSDRQNVINGVKSFYDKTGIQAYVALVDYTKLPGVVINEGKDKHALSVFFIIVGVVAVIYICYVWWGKKQQRKKEEAEETQKILSTPLEKFSDINSPEMNELMNKYDDKKD